MRYRSAQSVLLMLALLGTAMINAYAAENSVAFTAFVPSKAGSLTFGPRRAYAEGFGSQAGLRLVAGNSGSATSELHFEAYDAAFRPINNVELPASTRLRPGDRRTFLAIVPIMEDVKNRIRICAVLTTPDSRESRLCGRYIARKR